MLELPFLMLELLPRRLRIRIVHQGRGGCFQLVGINQAQGERLAVHAFPAVEKLVHE